MAHAVGDSHEFAIYGAHLLVTFPLFDANGDLISPSSPDSEISTDLGTFTDCTNEAVELAASSGSCYLYLTGAELTGSIATVQIKSTGAKTTILSIPIVRLPILASGTAQAGASSTITLAAGTSKVDNDLVGLFVRITNNSPSGAQYQARRIISNVASTQVATVDAAWGTNPSSASTYDLLAPSTANVGSLAGSQAAVVNQAIAYANLELGTAQAGAASTITLRAAASATSGLFIDQAIVLLSGTGAGQTNRITAYNGSTKVATVSTAWVTQPTSSTVYLILGRIG